LALTPGTRLGPYEVLVQIGVGGMGEVYKATDTNLKRSVAIKVLPASVAGDAERLARFQREAEVLAALNHPNIAQIHGLEKSAGTIALVMELVEGPTLADRIAQRAVPLDEALPIARQICEALEAAHEQGIIHRDLKPANIKVRADGTVKVLDFGLAKAMEPTTGMAANNSMSPTITTPAMTQAGIILGTAAYMSPEQAKGRTVDKRSDVWAFGAVLFEMLTGQQAFEGDDVSDTLARILMKEPDWTRLPATVPAAVVTVMRRCLQKDRKQRMRDIGDVSLALEGASETATPRTMAASSTPRLLVALVVVLFLVAAALVAVLVQGFRSPRESPAVRFVVPSPERTTFDSAGPGGGGTSFNAGSLSPDGRRIAFTARDDSGQVMLWLRALDAVTAQRLPGTEAASLPFWSPDSRTIGFFTLGKLKRIDANGGPVQTICDAPIGRGGTWNRGGVIVFAPSSPSNLFRVSASGGEPSPVTRLQDGEAEHRFPTFLPDGQHFVYLSQGADPNTRAVVVGSLDSTKGQPLLTADSPAVYAPPGYLLFVSQGTLQARPFDPARLEFTGDAVPIAEQVAFDGGARGFSVSENGTLAYRIGVGAPRYQLAWVDRSGALVESLGVPAALYQSPAISPDGRRIALHRHDATGGDIWLVEATGGKTSRLTFDASQDNSQPVWSPDGGRIVFGSRRNNKWGIYQKPSNGTGNEELFFESDMVKMPMSWSATNTVLFSVQDPKNGPDVWALPMAGDRKPVPLLQTAFAEQHPQISPDGKWFAYTSNETGRSEIYVQTLPPGGGKWQVSSSGGVFARWRPDGKELFYMERQSFGKIVAVGIQATSTTFEFSAPRPLFDSGYLNNAPGHTGNWNTFDVSSDGKRFLVPRPEAASLPSAPLTVVLNWQEELKRIVPTK